MTEDSMDEDPTEEYPLCKVSSIRIHIQSRPSNGCLMLNLPKFLISLPKGDYSIISLIR
jgi:hypothetical protein